MNGPELRLHNTHTNSPKLLELIEVKVNRVLVNRIGGGPLHLQYFDMVCNDLIKVKRFLTSFTIHGSSDTCSSSTKMEGQSFYSQGYSIFLFHTLHIFYLLCHIVALSAKFFTVHEGWFGTIDFEDTKITLSKFLIRFETNIILAWPKKNSKKNPTFCSKYSS